MNNKVNILQSTLRSYFESNDRVPIQNSGYIDEQK